MHHLWLIYFRNFHFLQYVFVFCFLKYTKFRFKTLLAFKLHAEWASQITIAKMKLWLQVNVLLCNCDSTIKFAHSTLGIVRRWMMIIESWKLGLCDKHHTTLLHRMLIHQWCHYLVLKMQFGKQPLIMSECVFNWHSCEINPRSA